MTPIEIACRHSCYDGADIFNCEAQAGEECNWQHCDCDVIHEHGMHAERIEDAAALGDIE